MIIFNNILPKSVHFQVETQISDDNFKMHIE
jgi:hypothetical protein